MNKDAAQKETLFKHFKAQGWYVQPEVCLYFRGGLQEAGKVISDVDVLALRPTPDLRWEKVLGDCKTLRQVSPANRAAWLHGMMLYTDASTGVLVLKRNSNTPIERDHKLFARDLNVTLLDEAEFGRYDKAICYPVGSSAVTESVKDLLDIRAVRAKFPALEDYINFIYVRSWNEQSDLDRLRKLIGNTRNVSGYLDPRRNDHMAVVLEAVGLFCVSLATVVGLVFNQYLCPETEAELDEALKIIVWGGKSSYEYTAQVRAALIKKKLDVPDATELSLPVWGDFIQVVRRLLECPNSAFRLPQIFQDFAVAILRERSPFASIGSDPNARIDLSNAMAAASYFCKAGKLPEEMRSTIRSLLTEAQVSRTGMAETRVKKNEAPRTQPDQIPLFKSDDQ